MNGIEKLTALAGILKESMAIKSYEDYKASNATTEVNL